VLIKDNTLLFCMLFYKMMLLQPTVVSYLIIIKDF